MPALEENLAVLLGAETEGRRRVEEAKAEAERIVEEAKRKFAAEAERRRNEARDQARTILETSKAAADAESQQLLDQGKSDRERMRRRFDENAAGVAEALAAEFVERLLRGSAA